MTFVIKDKIEIGDELQRGNIFDSEPYNYIFNKSTSFIDGDFVTNDHHQLNHVLKGLNNIDPFLLELLNYTKHVMVRKKKPESFMLKDIQAASVTKYEKTSALHKAMKGGNNHSVDLILEYMAKVKRNGSENFKDIFD